MKIATRLLLLFLLVGVLPLALFSYFNLQQDEVALRAEALGRMEGLADKKAIQIKSYLAEQVKDVKFIARDSEVMEGVDILSREYATGRRNAAYLRENAKLHQYFDRYVEESRLFYDMFLITPQGEIVYSQKHEADFATNLLSGTYRDSQFAQAFRAASMMLEPVISGYEFYAPSLTPALFIVSPIMVDGKFKGMFAAQLGNELLYRVATDATGLGLSGEVAFAQRDGDGALYTTPLKYRADAAMKLRLGLQQIKTTPMYGAIFGESGEGVKPDYRGTSVVAAWRYLPELNWGMVVKMDADEVFASIYRQRIVMLETVLGLLLFTGLLAYYFARQISLPLQEMARTAGEVSQGNLGKRTDESAPGELGLFARAFNRMAGNLQSLYRTLEDRIEERTRELNVTNEQLQEEIIERTLIESNLLASNNMLEHSQALLNEAQRLGKLGSWELDLVSGELHWSDEIFQIFELDPAQFAPSYENFLKVIHPDDRDRVNQAYTQSLKDYQAYDVLHRLLIADGRIKWVREHCTSYFDTAGKPLRSVGAVQDITEQKLAEDDLRIAASAFETHEAIMITDADERIVRVNSAFERITGYFGAEVIGRTPHMFSSGKHERTFFESMWQQIGSRGYWEGEIWDKRKNGEIYPKWLTITAVRDAASRVSNYVAIFSDIGQRKQAEEQIYSLAYYDALTKLPNRRLFQDRFDLALAASERNGHYGAVLFLDLDKFKILNDTLGHGYGDLLLIEVAMRLRTCVREMDTIARMGGDEFVVLVEDIAADAEEASQKVAHLAEKIRSALAQPYTLEQYEQHSSPSIGVCLYRGRDETVESLLKHADMAMYQAKDAGRNAVRFFDPVMQHAVESRSALEADLRRAVPDQQLHLYYQIQLDNEFRPLGAEALLRWIHPMRGMVSPALFIPLAEESSLILDIGQWVLDAACRQLQGWAKHEQMCNLIIAVNISAKQFMRVDFVEQVDAVIRKYQVNPELLKLELTESVVLGDVKGVVAAMHALKGLGVRLSMDDFGTGYSSLSYLKQLPLDQLKIDQSFVRDITSDLNDAVLVRAIIDLARNFRLNVIAEGVETKDQLEFLKINGCMAYQGYLFSKPIPIDQFEALLPGNQFMPKMH